MLNLRNWFINNFDLVEGAEARAVRAAVIEEVKTLPERFGLTIKQIVLDEVHADPSAFGLLAPDTIFAIIPNLGAIADKALETGNRELYTAESMDLKANEIKARALNHRNRGMRLTAAVANIRKSTGG